MTPIESRPSLLIETYLARRESLVRFFAARAGSRQAAEDLAQELYLKLAETEVGDVQNPLALLYRIATNLMLDRSRSAARAGARDAGWRQVNHAQIHGEDVADLPPPDEAAASRERLRQLVQAVEALPPQMGRAFRLHKLDGLSHAETARVMGLSVKRVEKHISAALKALSRGFP
ncbi:RNA polymerase sigma factor [Caulobacter mirabilis]|uniref:RNA polymerase subunit sigma-24 n=1 Tax=Caulobacter mirabilis TaxID=69666 RepID=A0A2D2B2T4_9CAUL|nr:RNA polymerase sigma factor [Caulobacter mirabilis]ATQ44575.1 RNA polymerase subunit sigma-24 [Caulobacter mirabilis]